MKRIYLSLAAGLASVLSAAAVEVGSTVNLTDNLCGRVLSVNGVNHKVEVSANADSRPSGDLEIKNTYFIGDDAFTVTRIAARGFAHSELTSVSVGADMTEIGSEAFNGCTRLAGFREMQPGSVVSLGDYAFAYTYALKELSLPGVATVGEFAFMSSKIERVEMPAVEYIYGGAFQDCLNLTEFVGGEKLRVIGNIAFTRCRSLKYMTLGSSLESIGTTAFAFNESLEQIVVPASLVEMGRDAFQGCGLRRVFILSDRFMDYCDAGKLLRNKSIEEIYCNAAIADDVKAYLAGGSEANPVESLTDADVKPMSDVLDLYHDGSMGEHRFSADKKIDGITGLQVFDSESGEEIPCEDGLYLVNGDKVRLVYRVDEYNLLDYVEDVDHTSGIGAVAVEPADCTGAAPVYYTLSGRRISGPFTGVCIRMLPGKTEKVMLRQSR